MKTPGHTAVLRMQLCNASRGALCRYRTHMLQDVANSLTSTCRALQAAAFKSALGTGCVSAGLFYFQAASVAGHRHGVTGINTTSRRRRRGQWNVGEWRQIWADQTEAQARMQAKKSNKGQRQGKHASGAK